MEKDIGFVMRVDYFDILSAAPNSMLFLIGSRVMNIDLIA